MNYKLLSGIVVTMSLMSLVGARVPATFMSAEHSETYPESQVKAIAAIGQDVANLKASFPQLSQFSVSEHVQSEHLKISYGYHTHRARHVGGWTSGVPNPDDDGVWFYIDFHDPKSTAQIHTQPEYPDNCFEDKKVSFLILEGKDTKPVSGAIWAILRRHGVKRCSEERPPE